MNVLITSSTQEHDDEASQVFDLAEQLRAEGHEVLVVVRQGSRLDQRVTARGLQMRRLSFGPPSAMLRRRMDIRSLRYLILAFRADVIHCHGDIDHQLAGTARARAGANIPIVRTVVERAWSYSRISANTDFTIALSKEVADDLRTIRGVQAAHLHVIYPAVEVAMFDPSRRSDRWRTEVGALQGEKLVGLIAPFNNFQAHHAFLEAAVSILSLAPNTRFVAAALRPGGSPEPYLCSALESGIADRISFQSFLENVPSALASLDVAIVTAGDSGTAPGALEYMASGTPVIAPREGWVGEVIEGGKTGLLVTPGDPASLARATVSVLTNPGFADNLRTAALEQIHEVHNRGRWIEAIMDVYKTAIAARSHAR
ncbi:MAG: glycosyltransferase family 4 protein [Candidatus Sumerlaeaceae bacterium]